MEFFQLIKASQKSGKPSAVCWFTAKTEARAKLQVQVILEDAEIETGRGQDYNNPVRTDFPVVDDLPEEGVIDFTWCDRYELQEDGRTWLPVAAQPAEDETDAGEPTTSKIIDTLDSLAPMPFRTQLLAQFLSPELHVYHINKEQQNVIAAMEMDTDDVYVQNLLLAAGNFPELKKIKMDELWKLTSSVRCIWSVEKAPELGLLMQFMKAWVYAHPIDRGLLAKEWAAGKRINSIQRTDNKTNAGGGNKTDRNPDYEHTLDTLDVEIALATLPMDFNIYDIPGGVYRRAKEIISKKESPFKEWSVALRKCAGILDYSRAAIFALIRGAEENTHRFPELLNRYINKSLTESNHSAPAAETLAAAGHAPDVSWESEINEQIAADQQSAAKQPEITSHGNGIFSVEGLIGTSQDQADTAPQTTNEATSDVQMEEIERRESETNVAASAGEGVVEDDQQTDTVAGTVCTGCGAIGGGHCPDCGAVMGDSTYAAMEAGLKEELDGSSADILATGCPGLADAVNTDANQISEEPNQNADIQHHSEPVAAEDEPQQQADEPAPEYPAYFEPGRYENLPNEVYHGANGISSTQVKDARVSLMYFNARHVEKTIQKERSKVLDMGNLVHALALQPENLNAEFSVEPAIPEGAFTTAATLREFIDEHNAALPAPLSADDIKALLEEYNATLPAQTPLGDDVAQTGENYMSLPPEFQRVEEGQKVTAAKMKACIKEYNATLPAQMKTSGSRDALLEQLARINPDLVAQEAQKQQQLKVSGTKADLIQSIKSVNPDAVFADELLAAWQENPEGKVLVTRQQLSTALAIQKALLQHPTAGKLLQHPSRAVEVSYFGYDGETGLEVRVRPDLEIDMDGLRIGADLKTISMWNIKQEGLRTKLHREIIERDYHLSAAMYCETAALDQFFWIFVNKDENYHWIAIIEASAELLELGMLEYRKAMRAIAAGFDTGEWPAPITDDYTDELNDFDMRRLEALRLA